MPARNALISICEQVCYFEAVECVSCDRLASAFAMRRAELWHSNPRLAERIEMRIQTARRAHNDAHGSNSEAERCLTERHPQLMTS